jgi:PAS domain S-box-containing protein
MIRAGGDSIAEVRRLQGCLNDMMAIMALPAMWRGRGATQIVTSLLDVLVGMLHLDFAYARLTDTSSGTPWEMFRPAVPVAGAEDSALRMVGESLALWLKRGSPGGRERTPNPLGVGTLAAAFYPLGLHDGIGVLVVGSQRADFPTQLEALVLQLAANQAAIGLQEQRRHAEQQRSAQTLEERVEERTAELSAVNAELHREIAERKRTEEARLLLASLVENSADFIGLASTAGSVLFLNPAGRELVGLEGAVEALGTNVLEFVGPAERERVEKEVWPSVLRVGRWDGELHLRHFSSGAMIPMLNHVFLIRDGNGEPVAVATISRDVTQRKLAEAELMALKDQLAADLSAMTRLHQLSERLQEINDAETVFDEVLRATIALHEADFGVVQVFNPRTQVLDIIAHVGFKRDFLDYFAHVSDTASACGRALSLGQRILIEDVEKDKGFAPHRAIARSAGFRAMQSTPLFGAGGGVVGMISTHFRHPHLPTVHQLRFTDLFARQAAERLARLRVETDLQTHQTYLAEGQRISHTGTWAWSAGSDEVYWSAEHYRIFGFEPGAFVPTREDFLAQVHPDERSSVRESFTRALGTGGDFDGEYRIVRADGSVRHLHCLGHPVRENRGILQYVGTVVDVTERKLSESALAKAREDLAHVARVTSMGELTASIAHEVNQPLAAVVTNANACLHWLAARPSNLQEAELTANRIIRDANRASQVIQRIRTFLTRGEPQHAPVQIADVIREVTELMAGKAMSKNVVLAVSGPDLPPVMGDRVQLQQVLINLVMNGIEAMAGEGAGSQTLRIIASREGPAEIRVAVIDRGPGLEEKARDRVFDAFYTTKPQGMGMGLAISRSIIEAHGGRLWAERNPDGGEVFQFSLPLGEGRS